MIKKSAPLMAVGLALLAGCSPASHKQPGWASDEEPPIRSITQVRTDTLQVTRPLDKYAPDDGENTLLKRAEAVVANRCLRGLGYRNHPLDEHATSNSDPNIYEFYWFPQAGRTGYSVDSPGQKEGNWDDSASKTEKKLLAGKLTTYQGHNVPKDGCYGEAGRKLTKNAQPPAKFSEQGLTITRIQDASPRGLLESYVSVIRQVLAAQIQKDSRIGQAVAAWSSCMKSKGYEYPSPAQAATDSRWQDNRTGKPSKEELATATADMACKKHVRYLDKVVAVESAYENRYISEHGAELRNFLRLRAAWQQNARDIVG